MGLDAPAPRPQRARFSFTAWRNRRVSSPAFQSWASRNPLTRGTARREGEEIFDLVAGFLHSQVLAAVIELGLLRDMLEVPQAVEELAQRHHVPVDRMVVLLQAATALGLLQRRRRGYVTSRKGAALLGVPGLDAMIAHHGTLYKDMADPVAFFRGETDPGLAKVWPYVFGPGAEIDPGRAQIYSDLMADSQALVAEETLRAVTFADSDVVMDVGGGTGVFVSAVAKANPDAEFILFDLAEVVAQAEDRLAKAGVGDRVRVAPGSFRTDTLPEGADSITLIRVCYDHADETVAALLTKIYDALPEGGRLVISEPMSGGTTPRRAGDAYFALYTLAMGTGRTRSPEQLRTLMRSAGFTQVKAHPTHRDFVTSVISGRKIRK
ncbi:MAG: methyltransferase [Rhodobacteraceae bacterium]|nr:methyltransferase [Paracoccaceae bacterium]